MKANELMIGDWVKTPVDMGKIQAINATCLPNFQTVEVWHKRYEDGRRASDYICDPLDLQPIPLTPEILEKNGFSLVEVGDNGTGTPSQYRNRFEKWLLKTTWKDVALWYDRLAKYYNVATMEGARIHYIHELQHALRLCGIEKEIEL